MIRYYKRDLSTYRYQKAEEKYKEVAYDGFIVFAVIFGSVALYRFIFTAVEVGVIVQSRMTNNGMWTGVKWCEDTFHFRSDNVTCLFEEECDPYKNRRLFYRYGAECYSMDKHPYWNTLYLGFVLYYIIILTYSYDRQKASEVTIRTVHYEHNDDDPF